ncbi:Zn-dependent protease with chaperone function [Desulfosporosinus acidiphilus SJ4]|uniref:Zn-dependent protease with chaperone function n=1 Tax=Desulfosporosinus acidiphilus (strain DSM 22704 / JCM 16185 / SJ4) TaxID=646529 RepID=I4DC20_DESAJ|nr:M48 family metallopeptidase [Desulfosporosinus acidiphilus]AFM43344.1 Zn-dependent protease with chaperone function [Desulfosporosinus acidiphilus SJ4]
MINYESRHVSLAWLIILGLTVIFAFLYLVSALFPAPIDPSVAKYFSITLAEKARTYNYTPRILFIVNFCLQVVLLSWLLFSSKGRSLFQSIQKFTKNYWLVTLLSVLGIWLISTLISLPFTYFSGYYWQKIWGFSTQSSAAWWMDYWKTTGIDLCISLAGGIIFFMLVNKASRSWWLIGSLLFSIWLVAEYFFWPIIVSPIFNHFKPVPDSAIVSMVNDLAHKAGLNVGAVLEMDASRQTTFANAYFTGVGTSKRIVIYDTLLHNYSLPEIKAVIAHEMGHWRHNDVIHGLLLGMAGGFIVFGLLTILLKPWLPKNSNKPPQLWAALQLAVILLLFVTSPIQNAVSRQMEQNADYFSLQLTGNLPAEIQLQEDLARNSLADLTPPAFIVWFSYDHPPTLARIQDLVQEYHSYH